MVIDPEPGRMRTRATAPLRRPVVCASGSGIGFVLCGATGVGLPRRTRATSVASRPSTMPSASTTCQARWISEAFGLYVGTRATFTAIRTRGRAGAQEATNKPTGTGRETASWAPCHVLLRGDAGRAPRRLRVGHRPETEAVGWGQRRGLRPVATGEDAQQLAGVLAGEPHVDERADHAANHLVAEGVGLDLEAQHTVAHVGPRRPAHLAHE